MHLDGHLDSHSPQRCCSHGAWLGDCVYRHMVLFGSFVAYDLAPNCEHMGGVSISLFPFTPIGSNSPVPAG